KPIKLQFWTEPYLSGDCCNCGLSNSGESGYFTQIFNFFNFNSTQMYDKDPVKIFVVEDDPAYTKFLKYVLGLNPDYETEFFTTGKECLANLHKNPSVITLDYS